jgi:hypothetical protein
MMKAALLLLVVLAVALGSANAQTALGSWQTGRSTFYQGIDGGNCGFGGISSTQFPFRYIAGTYSSLFIYLFFSFMVELSYRIYI